MAENRYPFLNGAIGALTIDYTPNVNLAMTQNLRSALLSCRIHNESQESWCNIEVRLTGESIKETPLLIDSIEGGSSVDVTKELDIIPDPDEMIRLTEARLTTFNIQMTIDGQQVLSQDLPLRLMPYDQWLGLSEHPEMVAAFVMPNHPMLSRVTANASQFMTKWTGNGAMNEYQSGDENRARQQVAAIYEALRSEGLVYVTPPASFEASGQRIRTVDKLLTEKLGTCIDLSLLFASCLESIGINPIIVFIKGHAFVGAWLVQTAAEMVGDDASYLLKSAADGISDLVFVETTLLTSSGQASFEDAVKAAMANLKDEENFRCYINVNECRINGVFPIAMRVLDGDKWVVINDTASRENMTKTVKRVDRYDLSKYDHEPAQVSKYTIWERKLLDFTLRNNLLNMKVGRRVLPILSFNINILEDKLQEGKNYQVLPFPLEGNIPAPEGIYDSSVYPQLEDTVTRNLGNGAIFSFLRENDLKDALKYCYRASRTSLEENGANNLYLVLGALKWFETPQSSQPRYAPLLLLPIEIVRGLRGSGYTIRTRDEEISLNITLSEMLKQQQDVDLSVLRVLPTDHSGVDVNEIFAIVRNKIRHKRGWNVIEEAMIGIFSFNKFVMWNDLHNNSKLMHTNPIISSLVEGRLNLSECGSNTEIGVVDHSYRPEEYITPIDVDSSQLEAVIDSGEGRSFILHGPPGTGKSQTITNMIANALYHGKRVLFVAEKMAALEVVQSRLAKIGLAPFCLELHSNKVTKQHFLQQMESALNVAHENLSVGFSQLSSELFDRRIQLITYIEALHTRHQSGFSLYDCITSYLSINDDAMTVDLEQVGLVTEKDIEEISVILSKIDVVFKVCGNPANSPLNGLIICDGSAQTEKDLRNAIKRCVELIDQIASPEIVQLCFDSGKRGELYNALSYWSSAQDKRNTIAKLYGTHLLKYNLDDLCSEWNNIKAKWFLPRFFAMRSFLKRLNLSREAMDHIALLHDNYNRDMSVFNEYAEELISIFGSDMSAAFKKMSLCIEFNSLFGIIKSKAIIEEDYSNIVDALRRWNANSAKLRDWYLWCHEKQQLDKMGLSCITSYILRGSYNSTQALKAFVKGYHYALAQDIINNDENLRHFKGLMFEEVIKSYRELTARFQQLSKRELFCKLAANVPSMAMAAYENSEVGILKRNIKSGGRGTSIRRLIDQMPTLLPRLSPCMLMSPLSVAQYIDLSNDKFDLVIFDEASQMPTSEAVGAIARGKALVVVGDPKQMPPTSFFSTQAVGEDEAYIDDMESILDDCLAMSIPSKYLTWHYRSKHESLIAFSNAHYYDGRLMTFPSVDDRSRKVSLRHIKGTYLRSGARVNIEEARAIVDEVIRRLSDPVLSKRSIGIVSFSKVQQDKIEDILTDELARHQGLEKKAYEGEEPIFIKNLENVQGDERDVILFSVGYGPDKTGKVSMNFGPLNNAGGERRLNVAVSRARYEMIVFSSIKGDDIDLRRTSALGVAGLKRFLEFAETGHTAVSLSSITDNGANVIASQIAEQLEKQGFSTAVRVGRSQFKVDVAVIDKDNPERYILGILLDGPNYYATKTVRDREVVQPSVLRMLQWNVTRVWTLDWFENPSQVIDEIVSMINEIYNGKAMPESALSEESIKSLEAIDFVPQEKQIFPIAEIPKSEYQTSDIASTPLKVATVDELAIHWREVLDQLHVIVETEQPVTSGLLYKRIVKLWGLSRVSPRLQKFVDELLLKKSGLHHSSMFDDKNLVWWTDAATAEAFKCYRTSSDRDILDVPTVEIENAMRFVIDQQIALQSEDLKRLTANELGYTRKGNNIERGCLIIKVGQPPFYVYHHLNQAAKQ